jgi:hypothetical protein
LADEDNVKNMVRKALDPGYYTDLHDDFTSGLPEKWKRVHVDHCIDQLRQAIQCHSDMTPAPLFSVQTLRENTFLGHSVTHTCRDFEAVQRWKYERNAKKKPWSGSM